MNLPFNVVFELRKTFKTPRCNIAQDLINYNVICTVITTVFQQVEL